MLNFTNNNSLTVNNFTTKYNSEIRRKQVWSPKHFLFFDGILMSISLILIEKSQIHSYRKGVYGPKISLSLWSHFFWIGPKFLLSPFSPFFGLNSKFLLSPWILTSLTPHRENFKSKRTSTCFFFLWIRPYEYSLWVHEYTTLWILLFCFFLLLT